MEHRDQLYDKFFKSLLDFIGALCETYPKCVHLGNMQMKLSLAMGQETLRNTIWESWNKFVAKHSDKIAKKDPVLINILAKETFFQPADLLGKWKSATPGIKGAIWAHIIRLAECSSFYSTVGKMPKETMDKLIATAQDVARTSTGPEISHTNIARAVETMNPMDIMGIYNSIPPGVLSMMMPMVQQGIRGGNPMNPANIMSMAQQAMNNPEFRVMAENMSKTMGLPGMPPQ